MSVPVRLVNYTDVYYGDRLHPGLDLMRGDGDSDEIAKFRLQRGDVILTKDSRDALTTSGSVPTCDEVSAGHGLRLPLVACPAAGLPSPVPALRPLVDACASADERRCHRCHAVRPSDQSQSESLSIWLPPLAEQRAIADYLDAETARIDALIAKKRRMIELLDERCRVAINSSVTRGLQGGVVLKDSGLESVGPVPRYWRKAPLSSLCLFQPGKAHEPFIDEDGEYICVNSRFVSTEGRTVKRCTQNLSPSKKSDILMVMSDLPNGRALAKAFFVDDDQPYAVNQRVCIISAHGIHPKFAFYQLNRNALFLRHDDGSNQTHLSNSVFTKFPLLVPPESEQAAIVNYLDGLTADIGAASQALIRQIDVLAEHRQAIITAAVTGERALAHPHDSCP